MDPERKGFDGFWGKRRVEKRMKTRQHRDLLRNRKVPGDACGDEINGADVIVAVVVVVVVFVAAAAIVTVIVASITSPRWKCYIRSGPKGDNTPRKGFAEINLPDR